MTRTNDWFLDPSSKSSPVSAFCLILSLLILGLPPVPVATAGTNAAEYYPLAVGNRWEYEAEFTRDGVRQRDRDTRTLSSRFELEGGAALYAWKEDGRDFLILGKRGIAGGSGYYLLRTPVVQGSGWSAEVGRESQSLFRYVQTGISMTVQGISYADCIEVVVTSGFQPIHRTSEGTQTDRTEEVASESRRYYAQGVGPILVELYDKNREGVRTFRYREELIRFTPGPSPSALESHNVTPLLFKIAQQALRKAEANIVYPPEMFVPRGAAAPYSGEAAERIYAAFMRMVGPRMNQPTPVDLSVPAVERLRQTIEDTREAYRSAGFDLDATIARLIDDAERWPEKIPPHSFMPMLSFQLGALLSECRASRLDCSQFFSDEAAIAVRKLADLEPPRK